MQKFEERIVEGDNYGVLQTIKTLIVRAQKKNDFKRAIELGRDGALLMLKHGHGTAGLDLSLNLVESWESSGKSVEEEDVQTVQKILEMFITGVKDRVEAVRLLTKFLDTAIEWSKASKAGKYVNGEPGIHHVAAITKLRGADFNGAYAHFIHAHQPQEFAAFLYEWSLKGYKNEQDLFLCRAVLELLAQQNLDDANKLFETFVAIMLSKKQKIDTPLFNYMRFLLRTMERDAYPLFKVLRDKYSPALRGDPTFEHQLDVIGDRFFGVKPKKQGMAAMFESMFGNMK